MDNETRIEELEQKYDELLEMHEELVKEFEYHRHTGLDSQQIDGTSFEETPFDKVTNPSDASALYDQSNAQEVVDAVNAIITILETTNITSDQ